MKVLHIIDSLDIGGAENLLINFIKRYKTSYPQDVHYVVTLANKNPLLREVLPYINNHACLYFSRLTFWKAVFSLKQLLQEWGIDVIHSHLFYSTIIARLARRKNIRMVTTYHNMEYCSESPLFSWKPPFIDRLTVPSQNHHAIFVSRPVATCVTNQIPGIKKFSILQNFVSENFYPHYQFRDNGELKLIAVGNLKTVKNHIYALKELALLKNKRITLDIYGKGELYDDLALFIEKNSLPVQIKQDIKITSELLAGYDVFLMPSISEGMPVSLIEAIVTGLPSIVTDLPQLRDTAEEAAIYFNHNEGVLCTILQQLLNNKSALKFMAAKTDKLREKFKITNYVDTVKCIYYQAK